MLKDHAETTCPPEYVAPALTFDRVSVHLALIYGILFILNDVHDIAPAEFMEAFTLGPLPPITPLAPNVDSVLPLIAPCNSPLSSYLH